LLLEGVQSIAVSMSVCTYGLRGGNAPWFHDSCVDFSTIWIVFLCVYL